MEKLVTAFVLVLVTAGKEREILEKLKEMPEVKEAYMVYGEYDLLLKVESETLKGLDNIIMGKIRKMPEIQLTSTLIAV
ncbi:MAG: Lrp/AsnC ligand binding domain-containing protein [Synergistetes bacterium]|nr:Lrp/AsnC ligand binding domain-containing protein [Synergistota bacterium]